MRRAIIAVAVGAVAAIAAATPVSAHIPDRVDDPIRRPVHGASVRELAGDVTADLIGSVPLGRSVSGGTTGDFAEIRRR